MRRLSYQLIIQLTIQLGLLLLLTVLLLQHPALQAEDLRRAGLVVQLGDATVITRCVAFQGEQITGMALLKQSGLDLTIATDPSFGEFVCKIDREGCPADDCLCAYPPNFWRYWLLVDGAWQFAPVGASSRTLRTGDVDGWVWGGDAADTPATLPTISFAEICPAATNNLTYLPLMVTGGE